MYHDIFHIGNIVFYILMAISFLLLLQKIFNHFLALFRSKRMPEAKADHSYAILIPARNESKVIEQLLISIKNQNYNLNLLRAYVIVESESDPTCEICKKYDFAEVFVRKHLENKGKGYALDEAVKHILETKNGAFDAFFIFDADNVLDKNYIYEMNKCFDAGYKFALGYRNSKNWNDGWVASCSALTFSMVNTFQNKGKSRFDQYITVSGTGFYIAADIIEKLGGWDFHTLTEDYEISSFCALHGIKSIYNEYAEYYDEQPTSFKTSCNQRLRWCKGYNQVNKKYQMQLLKSSFTSEDNHLKKFNFATSLFPVMFLLISVAAYTLFTLVLAIVGSCIGAIAATSVWIAFGIVIATIYIFFILYAAFMLLVEKKHTNITFKNALICCLMNPIFTISYVPIFVISIFKKEVEWKTIEHKVQIENSTLSQVDDTLTDAASK